MLLGDKLVSLVHCRPGMCSFPDVRETACTYDVYEFLRVAVME